MKKIIIILIFIFQLVMVNDIFAQGIIKPNGASLRASSQLVFWYDNDFESNVINGRITTTFIQITNTNNSSDVWIHVQIYKSENPGVTPPLNTSFDQVERCREVNFVDFLTPNDTHVYTLPLNNFLNEDNGIQTVSAPNSKGFVIITPIVSRNDNRPISFPHLTGTTVVAGIFPIITPQLAVERYGVHAMGRDAVDFTTGDRVTSGTVLDGVSSGFVVLQPDEMFFNFDLPDAPSFADIVGITFIDQYNEDDTLGYRAVAGETTWSPFIHDSDESRLSCAPLTNSCFNNFGLNEQVPQLNLLIDNARVCAGVNINVDPNLNRVLGWTRLLIDGYDTFENQLGVVAFTFFTGGSIRAGAEWMNVAGQSSQPPQECNNIPADCVDPICKQEAGCENPNSPGQEDFCIDNIDNDDDGFVDCADLGCDGFEPDTSIIPTLVQGIGIGPCEPLGETSCEDGFDNDNNGEIDCGIGEIPADSNCVALGLCGDDDDDDDSGGCNLAAGSVATGTAAANFLLPLLPLAGAYALRRIRRATKK